MQLSLGRALEPPLDAAEETLRRPRTPQLRPRLLVYAQADGLAGLLLVLVQELREVGAQCPHLGQLRLVAEEPQGKRFAELDAVRVLGKYVRTAFDHEYFGFFVTPELHQAEIAILAHGGDGGACRRHG